MTLMKLAKMMGMRFNMTRDKLCSLIAKRENKKVAISIGNVREIMRILIEIQVEFALDPESVIEDSPIHIVLEEANKKIRAKESKKKAK
jgi:hypothetical protein